MRGRFTFLIRLRSWLVVSWLLPLAAHAPALAQTVAQTAAVFDFELIDTSLEGEIKGPRPDEQARLGRLSDQLRLRLKESGRFALVDIASVLGEAHASNLQACGGCDAQLAKRL